MTHKIKRLKNTSSSFVILLGLLFGALYWILESAVQVYFLDQGTLASQILSPDITQIPTRSSIVFLFLLISVYARHMMNRQKEYAEDLSARNDELDAARVELACSNEKLEQRVKERTAEVERLLAHKDEFISQLGHDLKTPLTPLVALLPTIRNAEHDPKSRELLDV